MEFHGELKLPNEKEIINKFGLGDHQRVQRYIDMEVLRRCEPYIPFQTGVLQELGVLGTDVGSGEVTWIGPYARYQYYGKVMVGKAPKKVTDIPLKYNGAPMRGAFWFERMKADQGEEIVEGANKIAKGEV